MLLLELEKSGEGGTVNVTDYSKALTISKVIEETLKLKEEAENQHVILKDTIINIPLGMTYNELDNLLDCSQTPKYHSIVEGETYTSNLVTDTSSVIATGDTVTVGTKIWTISVKGDVDGDGELSVNDIGAAKMHFIGSAILSGVYLEAIENDNVEGIGVNDIGRLKLAYIGKLKDLYSDLDNE